MKPLADIPKLHNTIWREAGDVAVRETKQLTAQGKGAEGQFPAYSEDYRRRKSQGWIGRNGKPKRFKRQASYSATPDLRLTGDMMRDLATLEVTDHGVIVGWAVHGARVEHNAGNGRPISTDEQPLARSVIDAVMARINAALDANERAASGTETITVGKRV